MPFRYESQHLPKFTVYNMFIAKNDNVERIRNVKPSPRGLFAVFAIFAYVQNIRDSPPLELPTQKWGNVQICPNFEIRHFFIHLEIIFTPPPQLTYVL